MRHRRHSELWVMRYRAALIAAGLGLLAYVLATWVLIHRGQFVTGIGSGFSLEGAEAVAQGEAWIYSVSGAFIYLSLLTASGLLLLSGHRVFAIAMPVLGIASPLLNVVLDYALWGDVLYPTSLLLALVGLLEVPLLIAARVTPQVSHRRLSRREVEGLLLCSIVALII